MTSGRLLIAAAALLWATDALVRYPSSHSLDPTLIVAFEHVLGTLALFPFVWKLRRRALFSLRGREWLEAVGIGLGGSALATVLFTASFRTLNPSLTILLQKLQPVLVVLIARFWLKEHPKPRFYPWAGAALAAAVVLAVPDFQFAPLFSGTDVRARGLLYAVQAAALWAVSTVAGKALLKRADVAVATFWRFAFGGLGLILMMAILGKPWNPPALHDPGVLLRLSYLSLFPGLAAMLAYYAGLRRISASSTTFIELIFPVAAVALNTWILGVPISGVQLGAGALLILAVTRASAHAP